MAKLNISVSNNVSRPKAARLFDLFQRRPLFSVLMIFLVDLVLSLLITQLFKE